MPSKINTPPSLCDLKAPLILSPSRVQTKRCSTSARRTKCEWQISSISCSEEKSTAKKLRWGLHRTTSSSWSRRQSLNPGSSKSQERTTPKCRDAHRPVRTKPTLRLTYLCRKLKRWLKSSPSTVFIQLDDTATSLCSLELSRVRSHTCWALQALTPNANRWVTLSSMIS